MKRVVGFFLLLVLLITCCKANEPVPLNKSDFVFLSSGDGVSIGLLETIPEIEKKMGEPKAREEKIFSVSSLIKLEYEGIYIYYFKNSLEVDTIGINSRKYVLPRGLSVGNNFQEFLAKYGNPTITEIINENRHIAVYEFNNPIPRGIVEKAKYVMTLELDHEDVVKEIYFSFNT